MAQDTNVNNGTAGEAGVPHPAHSQHYDKSLDHVPANARVETLVHQEGELPAQVRSADNSKVAM